MSADQYLDYRGSADRLAPREAVIHPPVPVVVVAQLSDFASEVFEPRAILRATAEEPGARLVIEPVGGAGIIIEDFSWFVDGTPATRGVWGMARHVTRVVAIGALGQANRLEIGATSGTTFRADTGGGLVLTDVMQFPSSGASQLLDDERIFVPAGGQLVIGLDQRADDVAFDYQLTVREITTAPSSV